MAEKVVGDKTLDEILENPREYTRCSLVLDHLIIDRLYKETSSMVVHQESGKKKVLVFAFTTARMVANVSEAKDIIKIIAKLKEDRDCFYLEAYRLENKSLGELVFYGKE